MTGQDLDGAVPPHRDVGSGRPALVFVHGMCGGGWVWNDQVARLHDRFRCVTYDRRGHGPSDGDRHPGRAAGHRAADQSAVVHAADLAALIEGAGLDRPVVVGSSSGAVVALELLHRRPDLLSGLVVSEPPLFTLDPDIGVALSGSLDEPLRAAVATGGPAAALEVFFAEVCPTLWERTDDEGRARYRANAGLLFPTLSAPGPSVGIEDLTRVDVPVRVVTGGRSHAGMRRLAGLLAGVIPQAELVELPDAGHATYVDAPGAFAAAVADLARSLTT